MHVCNRIFVILFDIYSFFTSNKQHTPSIFLQNDSKQTQHVKWDIISRSFQLNKNIPLMLTQNPSSKISFSPKSILSLHMILENLF